jgi:uncharacterized protein YdeI (YjbR/CyaY-like superfamily)
MKKNIEAFFEERKKWKAAYTHLRKLILDTGLNKEFKWGENPATLSKIKI